MKSKWSEKENNLHLSLVYLAFSLAVISIGYALAK